MSYQNEIPVKDWPTDAEVEQMEAAGLVDTSWHNDACASWSFMGKDGEEQLVTVWVDSENPNRRERGGDRFAVCYGECRNYADIYEGDDLGDAIRAAADALSS